MTQEEFEKLTGKEVDANTYEVVNAMYMSHPNMSKQDFCEMFMKMGLMNYAKERAEYTAKLRREVEAQTARAMEAEHECKKISERDAADLNERNQKIAKLEQELHDFLQMTAVYLHTGKEDVLRDVVRERMGVLKYYKELQASGCTPNKSDLEMFIKVMEEIQM